MSKVVLGKEKAACGQVGVGGGEGAVPPGVVC